MSKTDTLINEAEVDLKERCFNKAVSASYFAVRMEIEVLANKLRLTVPRRDDKLINILKYLGMDELAEEAFYLYQRRKDADYGEIEIDEATATYCLNIAKKIIEKLREFLDSLE
jgi:uncharacterized protein (UPF0332 family)